MARLDLLDLQGLQGLQGHKALRVLQDSPVLRELKERLTPECGYQANRP